MASPWGQQDSVTGYARVGLPDAEGRSTSVKPGDSVLRDMLLFVSWHYTPERRPWTKQTPCWPISRRSSRMWMPGWIRQTTAWGEDDRGPFSRQRTAVGSSTIWLRPSSTA